MGKTVPTSVTLLLLGVILMAALPAQAASVSMREGLYLEEVEGDLEGAILIYQGIIDDQTAAENIVAQALYHQGLCYMKQGRETEAKAAFTQVIDDHSSQTDLLARIKPLLDELGNADPAALMPPETIAYVELGSPGQQIETILNMLKGTPLENPLEMIRNAAGASGPDGVGTQVTALAALLNPNMTAEFKKVRGMGLGITGVNENGPSFIAVLFPGKSDALRGLLQMVLGMVGQPADDIETMHCLTISEQVAVAYDDNVVILTQAEPDHRQLRWCIQQYLGLTHEPTLASSNSAFATVDKRSRQQNALTVWLNVGQTYNRLDELIPGGEIPPQIQMVNRFVDFANVRDLIASLSLQAAGLTVGADVNLNEGHNCMAYNIAHTPALDKTVLRAVPADAIAVASIGLGPSDTMQAQMLSQQLAGALGMDIGAALFDNIDQITVFALPFIASAQRDGAELNSLGLIITSENPQETYDLIGGALRTAEAVREESEPVAGRYQFTFANNVTHGHAAFAIDCSPQTKYPPIFPPALPA